MPRFKGRVKRPVHPDHGHPRRGDHPAVHDGGDLGRQQRLVTIWPVGRSVHVAGMIFTSTQLVVIGIAAAVSLAMHSLLKYTRVGKAMRAIAVNERLARNCGISVRRVTTHLAALGRLERPRRGRPRHGRADPQLRHGRRLPHLDSGRRVLGGIGSPYGAMLGALIIGVSSEVAAGFINPAFKDRDGVHRPRSRAPRPPDRSGELQLPPQRRWRGELGLAVLRGDPARLRLRLHHRRHGLNLQFGVTGIYNFAFIMFQACGAYTTAVLTLGRSTKSFQHFILGYSLPFRSRSSQAVS